MAKTNKSYSKRIKLTKNGKMVVRAGHQNHNRAKQRRSKQLAGRRLTPFGNATIRKTVVERFLRK